MNVVDSSGWLEYFAAGPNAGAFAKAIQDTRRLLVPSIVLLEVFRHVCRQRGEREANLAIEPLRCGTLVPLDETLAIAAANIGVGERLPLADSVILATARICNATLWTQDAHFAGMEGVWFFPKTATPGISDT